MKRGWHILDFIVFNTQKCYNLLQKMQLLQFVIQDGAFYQGCDSPLTSKIENMECFYIFQQLTTFKRQLLLQNSTP